MNTDIEIDFQLLATTIPPREISRLMELQPDAEWAKGERNPLLGLPKVSIWAIRSVASSNQVGDHWRNLDRVLTPKREIVKRISDTGTARITIIVSGNVRLPSIIIPPSMSEFAAYLKAEIEIDHQQP